MTQDRAWIQHNMRASFFRTIRVYPENTYTSGCQ